MSCKDEGLFLGGFRFDVGDWTSLQVGDLLDFVELSFIWSGLTTRPDPAPPENGVVVVFLRVRGKTIATPCISFSPIIVKSLQLRGRRQIAESRKYCLVHVIIFLWRVFSLFFLFLIGWEFGFIPYTLSLAYCTTYIFIYIYLYIYFFWKFS